MTISVALRDPKRRKRKIKSKKTKGMGVLVGVYETKGYKNEIFKYNRSDLIKIYKLVKAILLLKLIC